MTSIEQVRNIINGLYLGIRDNNYDLLNKTVNGLDGKFTNSLFRAYLGYRNLEFKYVYMCMKLSAEYLHDFYGRAPVEDSEEADFFWREACAEPNRRIMEICSNDEDNKFLREYATNVFLECLNVLEAEYTNRKLNNNDN